MHTNTYNREKKKTNIQLHCVRSNETTIKKIPNQFNKTLQEKKLHSFKK